MTNVECIVQDFKEQFELLTKKEKEDIIVQLLNIEEFKNLLFANLVTKRFT